MSTLHLVFGTQVGKVRKNNGRQAIPMVFDYPESNPFCASSGSAINQLEWISRYIESESQYCFSINSVNNASSGEKTQFSEKFITAVVTDPPYYDAIAYADLSDFFYVWLKRTIGDVFPLNFATPQTPKTEECTALKHHHNGNLAIAKSHFENKLLQIFDAIEHQTSDISDYNVCSPKHRSMDYTLQFYTWCKDEHYWQLGNRYRNDGCSKNR